MRLVYVSLGMLLLSGCSLPTIENVKPPETPAEIRQGPTYSYRPFDPMDVKLQRPNEQVSVTNCRILELLPDETMRFAVGQVDMSGKVSYGVASAGVVGQRYVVVLDYMKSTTFQHPKPTLEVSASTVRSAPTYVGIGLRLTANLVVHKGTIDLASLLSLGMAGEAKQVSGSLMLQTLGVSGPSISSALAIPSDISTASIQAALVSIGTIKSKIYDADTSISPRVVGTYDVFGTQSDKFDAYFDTLLSNPPELKIRINNPRCDGTS
jgi:hypothetical protein